jgi:signal transduction histidine kinase
MPYLFPRIRDVLIALLVGMGIISLLAFVQLVREVREDLEGSQWVEEINHLGNALFDEATGVARERGLTTLALTLGELPPDLQQELEATRRRAEAQHQVLLRQIERVLRAAETPALSLLATSLGESHAALQRMRPVVADQIAGRDMGVSPDVWFATASRYNDSIGRMQDAICSVRPPSFAFFDFCPAVKRDIFWVGEYATRERGLVAGAIAAGRPFTPAELDDLHAFRAVIEHNLDRISTGARSRFPGQAGVGAIVNQVRIEYAGRYAEALRATIAAGTGGDAYPVDAVTWYRQATASIDPLLDLTVTLSAAIDASVEQFRDTNLNMSIAIAALLAIVVASFATTAFVVQRRVLSRLGRLQAAARAIGENDLTHPVTISGVDELGEFGEAFEGMRRALWVDRRRREATEAQLRNANEELARFAYVVSHDLKAPLRAIHNLAGWLAQDFAASLDAQGREHLALLQSRVRRMDHLIGALLEYSRIGRRGGAIEEVSVRELVEEVVELRGLSGGFTVTVRDPMPRLVTDRVQLQQVFANLIGNAIEHHDRSDGRVEVSAEDANAFWRFTVSDDGPGIPPEQHERIFEIFQRFDTRDSEGTGIGLAIVKKAVERLGGAVTVESEPGHGATFRFTWPKRPPLEPSLEPLPGAAVEVTAPPRRSSG